VVPLILIAGCGDDDDETRKVRVEVSSSTPVEVAVSVEGVQFTARTPVVRDVTVRADCFEGFVHSCFIDGSAAAPSNFQGTLTLCLEDAGERECQSGSVVVFVTLEIFP
jgi:hypothetical protein